MSNIAYADNSLIQGWAPSWPDSRPGITPVFAVVALVPRRLVQDRANRLQVGECPFPVTGFSISSLWHERNHGHAAQRCVRERLIEATAAASNAPSPDEPRRADERNPGHAVATDRT